MLFVFGEAAESKFFYFIGGIGMVATMLIMIIGDGKKIVSFATAMALGILLGALFFNWYSGLFWITFLFVLGQIFGLIGVLINFRNILSEHGHIRPAIMDYVYFSFQIILPYFITVNSLLS